MKVISDIRSEYDRNIMVRASILDGLQYDEISDMYDVKISFIKRLSNDKIFKNVQKGIMARIDRVESIGLDFKEGMTLEDLSEKYDTTRQNISRVLKIAEVDRSEGGVSKMKDKRIEELIKYNDKGYTLERISAKMGLEEDIIRNYAYDIGLSLNSETKVRVNKLVDDILKMRRSGKTQSTISDVLGVSQSYVSKILLTNDMRTFKSFDEYEMRDEKVASMYNLGEDIKDIMKEMNLSESNVRRIIYKERDKKEITKKEYI